MEETVSTELKLSELRTQTFRDTVNNLHDRASSILLLTLQWKDIEDHLDSTHSNIEQRANELHAIRESVELKLEEIKNREKECEVIKESLDVRVREVEEREREFELIQKKEIEERQKHVEFIENSRKEVEGVRELVDKIMSDVKDRESEFELLSKQIEEKGNEVSERSKEIDAKERFCEQIMSELKVKEKQFFEQKDEIEMKERMLMERVQEFELKEEETRDKCRKPFVKGNAINDANVHLCVSMDGKALQMFLNEHCEDLDLMRDEVFFALELSSNPAKVVLDAMQGFYLPRLNKGDLDFDEGVVRKSCVFLLELLMKVTTEISPDVKNEAKGLSFNWSTQMKRDSEHFIEVLGFLLLLASYKLASAFDANEILSCLEIVAHHNQAPELLLALSLKDNISGFLQNLITQNKHIEAIRFIYSFELVNDFPPAPLLEEYLKDCTNAISKSRMRGKSIENRIEATNKILDHMRAAHRCIEDCKIESEVSTKCLKQQIECLEKANSNRIAMLVPKCKSEPSYKERKHLISKVIPASAICDFAPKSKSTGSPAIMCPMMTSTSASAPAPSTSQKLSANKRPWSAISVEDDQNCFGESASVVASAKMNSQHPAELLLAEQGIACGADNSLSLVNPIQELINRNQHLEAIKCIYESEMVDKFSPVCLLRDHVSYLKNVEKSCSKQNSITSQIDSIAKEIAGFRAVIDCIATYNLESEFSPKNLEEHVIQLEKKMAEKKQEFELCKTKIGPLTKSKRKRLQGKFKSSCRSMATPAASPVKMTFPSAYTCPDPLDTMTSPSLATTCTAASITVTSPTPTVASTAPNTTTSFTTTQSSAVPTSEALFPSPTAPSIDPVRVSTPSPNTALPSSSTSKTKKPKLKHKNSNRPPRTVVSSGKPAPNNSRGSAYHLQPSRQFRYINGEPFLNTTAGYHRLAGYPTSNPHLGPYFNHVNPHHHWDACSHSNSGYFSPVNSWRP